MDVNDPTPADDDPDDATGGEGRAGGDGSDRAASRLDLRPHAVGAPRHRAGRPRGRQRMVGIAVLLGVLGVAGYAVAQALDDATLFFRNVDEAVAARPEIGDDRFRIHGIVEEDSVVAFRGGVAFTVSYDGVLADVEHTGDPVELFQPGVPVVLEGRWSSTDDDAVFLSDRMLVRHDEIYEEGEPERYELPAVDEDGAYAGVPGDAADAGRDADGGAGADGSAPAP